MFTLYLYKDTEVLLNYGNKKKPHFCIGPYSEFHLELPRRTPLKDVDALLYKFRHDFKRAKPAATKNIKYGTYNLSVEEASVLSMKLSSDGKILQIPLGTPLYKAFFYILHLSGDLQQHCFLTFGAITAKIEFKEEEEIFFSLLAEDKPFFRVPFALSTEEIAKRVDNLLTMLLHIRERAERAAALFDTLKEQDRREKMASSLAQEQKIQEQLSKHPALKERVEQLLFKGLQEAESFAKISKYAKSCIGETWKIYKELQDSEENPQGISLQKATDCLVKTYEGIQALEKMTEDFLNTTKELKELDQIIMQLSKEAANQAMPSESSGQSNAQMRTKEEVLQGISELISDDTEQTNTLSTRMIIDDTLVFVEFTEEEPLPRFAQDEKGNYILSVPPSARTKEIDVFAQIYLYAQKYWDDVLKSGKKPRKKQAKTVIIRDLAIDFEFTNESIEPRFSQKTKNHYLLSLHPLTNLQLANAYGKLYGITEMLKREAARKTVSYNNVSAQIEFAEISTSKLSHNADGSITIRMPKGSNYERAELLLKAYYEQHAAELQSLPQKEAEKPHYELPFIFVTPKGETTVYLPTEDAQAEQAFLEKHQKRVEEIVSFIQEKYNASSDAEEPIALLFEDLDVISWHKDIKKIHFQASPQRKIEVLLPRSCSFMQAFQYIVVNHDVAVQNQDKTAQNYYTKESSIKVWGKEYKLDVSVSKELPAVQIHGDTVYMHLSKEGEEFTKSIYSWYSSLLDAEVKKILKEYLPKMGARVQQYTLSLMTSRWGSYSPKTKTISLNFMLIHYPLRCLRGVIIHLLAHSFVKTHTPEFYQILERFCPDWKEIDAELKTEKNMTY